MEYNFLSINFFPIIGSIFLIIFLWRNSNLTSDIKLYFYSIIATSCIELVVYNLELILINTSCSVVLLTLITCMGYFLRPIMMYFLLLLITRDNFTKKYRYLMLIPIGINTVFSISGFFTDLTYSYDSNHVFHRGPLGWTAHIVMLLYLVSMIFLSLRYKHKHLRFEKVIVLEIAFILIFGAFAESLLGNISVLRTAITASMVFYYMYFQSVVYSNDISTKQTEQANKFERFSYQVVTALALTVDAKDSYTNGHSQRVADYSKEIAKRMGMDDEFIRDIYFMGLLHDIGKIGIPDQIINKKGRLTDDEYRVIQAHPAIGADVLRKITEMPSLYCGARWHHERYDGKGYPDGISGTEIPIEARIIAVADAYDAMSSRRSYRDAMPQADIRKEIVRVRGTQLDPEIADILIQMIDEDVNYEMREHY